MFLNPKTVKSILRGILPLLALAALALVCAGCSGFAVKVSADGSMLGVGGSLLKKTDLQGLKISRISAGGDRFEGSLESNKTDVDAEMLGQILGSAVRTAAKP